ncbi:hypothetical protein ABK040_009437 [Willaertia magna]
MLLNNAKQTIHWRLAPSTVQGYYKVYKKYLAFCKFYDLPVGETVTTEAFMSFIISMSTHAWMITRFKPALDHFSVVDKFEFKWNNRLADIKAGMEKIYNSVIKNKRERDPFPVPYLWFWIKNASSHFDKFYFTLAAAIIATGLRLLARSDELIELKWS